MYIHPQSSTGTNKSSKHQTFSIILFKPHSTHHSFSQSKHTQNPISFYRSALLKKIFMSPHKDESMYVYIEKNDEKNGKWTDYAKSP